MGETKYVKLADNKMSTNNLFKVLLVFTAVVVLALLCGILVKLDVSKAKLVNLEESPQQPPQFDYLQFVVQWPQSVCLHYKATSTMEVGYAPTQCKIPPSINIWTIHGTWPTRFESQGPLNCNNSWHFEWNKIKNLQTELNQLWPNFLSGGGHSSKSFWSHEWKAHGTCAASVPALYGERKYFGRTLEMRNRFNIDEILRSHHIVPSSQAQYRYSQILKAFKNKIGTSTRIKCYKKHGHYYLEEVVICLSKSLDPIDCPRLSYKCPTSGIELPPIKH